MASSRPIAAIWYSAAPTKCFKLDLHTDKPSPRRFTGATDFVNDIQISPMAKPSPLGQKTAILDSGTMWR
ncbi:MAG: hypothetical protein IPL33_12885 [Sphingobacteriales bacterium]|nr:hypothetical protein [Sphingobacteriales bacterium]